MLKYCIFLLPFFPIVHAYQSFHQLGPGASYDSIASGGACTTFTKSKYTINCNPALFTSLDKNELSLRAIGKVDGDAVNNSKDLLTKKIEEQTLRDLFAKDSYNSLTLNTSIELITDKFIIGYTPAYYLSDVLLFNPALPQISMLLVKKDETYITSGLRLGELLNPMWNFVSMGATLRYSNFRVTNNNFSLIDLNDSSRVEEIKNLKKHQGFEADLGLYIAPPLNYLPNMAIVVKNLNSPYPHRKIENETDGIETYHLFEPRIDFGLGYPVSFDWGKVELALLVPWSKEVHDPSKETVITGRYTLDYFTLNASTGYYHQNIGFITATDNYSLGLIFTNEKELRGFNAEYQKSVYLSLEVVFQ